MKRINPLYFVLLLITITIVSYSIANKSEKVFKEKNKNYIQLENRVLSYKEINNSWYSQKYINDNLQKIINNPILKNENIKIINKKEDVIEVVYKFNDPKKSSMFIDMVLNLYIKIDELTITEDLIKLKIGKK